METNNAYIQCVDRLQDEPILVALQCLRRCPDEIADDFWPPDSRTKKVKLKPPSGGNTSVVADSIEEDNATASELPAIPSEPVQPEANEDG